MPARLHASQKNDYPITVMRGHSITEIILSESEVGYTGIDRPAAVIALAEEGVNWRKSLFGRLSEDVLVLKAPGIELPPCTARVIELDFKARKIKPQDWALAALAWLADKNRVLTREMRRSALELRFKGKVLESAVVEGTSNIQKTIIAGIACGHQANR